MSSLAWINAPGSNVVSTCENEMALHITDLLLSCLCKIELKHRHLFQTAVRLRDCEQYCGALGKPTSWREC